MEGFRNFVQKRTIACLLGGLCIDENVITSINVFHFGLWFGLFGIPYCISLITTSIVAEAVYTCFVFLVFSIIKSLNYIFHKEFDGKMHMFHKRDSIHQKDIRVRTLKSPQLAFTKRIRDIESGNVGPSNKGKMKEAPSYSFAQPDTPPQVNDGFVARSSNHVNNDVAHPSPLASSQVHMISSSNVGDLESDSEDEEEPAAKPSPSLPPTRLEIRFFKFAPLFSFERIDLLNTFDQSHHWMDVVIAPLFATGCTWLGFFFLEYYEFNWFRYLVLWASVTAALFSLLWCPKPDSSSPRSEYSRFTPYSRAIYLVLAGALVKILDSCSNNSSFQRTFNFYNLFIDPSMITAHLRQILVVLVLYSPLFHVFGLLPQPDTLLIYTLEQINIILFGGSGNSNLRSAIFDFSRNCGSVAILYALGVHSKSRNSVEITFYIALLVFFTFLWSRIHTDPFIILRSLLLLRKERKARRTITPSPSTVQTLKRPSIDTSSPNLIRMSENANESIHKHTTFSPTRKTIKWCADRLIFDVLAGFLLFGLAAGLHRTQVFGEFEKQSNYRAFWIYGTLGFCFLIGYVIPELRRPYPFKTFTAAIIGRDDSKSKRKVETFSVSCEWILRFIFFPMLLLSAIVSEWGLLEAHIRSKKLSVLFTTIAGTTLLRGAFTHPSRHTWSLLFTRLFFTHDMGLTESFIIDFYLMSIAVSKVQEMRLKIEFGIIYALAWSKSWGSVVHSILQPLGFPHLVLYLFQVFISSLLSVPLSPLIGSALFFMSYGRPIKFWERGYVSTRVSAKSRVQTHGDLNRSPALFSTPPLNSTVPPTVHHNVNFNHVDSIFYEHLLSAWQDTLARDILLGRLGVVAEGDIFILMNDKLTTFLHLIELGSYYCVFQIRGLEFKGTYCQERELGAISRQSYLDRDENVIASILDHEIPIMSFHDMFAFRWRTWDVITTEFSTCTYSISLNPAYSMFCSYDLRRAYTTLYVKAVLYHLIKSPILDQWLQDPNLPLSLAKYDKKFSEIDPHFTAGVDIDFDEGFLGITLDSFMAAYGKWINMCCHKLKKSPSLALIQLSLALALYARLVILPKDLDKYDNVSAFLSNLASLLRADIDFSTTFECEFMHPAAREIIFSAVNMSFILFLDSFTSPDEYNNEQYVLELVERTAMRYSPNFSRFYTLPSYSHTQNYTKNTNVVSTKSVKHINVQQSPNIEPINNNNSNINNINVNNTLNEIQEDNPQPPNEDERSTTISNPETPPSSNESRNAQEELDSGFSVYNTAVGDETSHSWRQNVMNNTPQLVSLRKVELEARQAGDDWSVLMLTLMDQKFKVVKVNKESVRGFWAAQQQELVYLGSTNSERGSIQQLRNVLRNLINQSCDFPVGYPIYVSPPTTSYTSLTSALGASPAALFRRFLDKLVPNQRKKK